MLAGLTPDPRIHEWVVPSGNPYLACRQRELNLHLPGLTYQTFLAELSPGERVAPDVILAVFYGGMKSAVMKIDNKGAELA